MATQLTIVNNVLRRLREDTVTSVADNAYAQLIAMWVNDGMREVSNAYAWSSLLDVVGFDVVQGTHSYNLSQTVADGGAVAVGPVTTDESLLAFDSENRPVAFLYESSSSTKPLTRLTYVSEHDQWYYRGEQDTSVQVDNPCRFGADFRNSTGAGYAFKFLDTPATARYATIAVWTPQADLSIDGTDDSTTVVVHSPSVEAYTHMVAANERGEEIGEPGNLLERRYMDILAAAIEATASSDYRANLYESRRD